MFGIKKNEEQQNPGSQPDAQKAPDAQKTEKKKDPAVQQLFYSRITCAAAVVMALALVITVIVLVPRAVGTLEQVNSLIEDVTETVSDANEVIANANTTLGGFDEMSKEITTAAEGINGLVDENSDVLTDSMNKLNSIDFEGLNNAIKDLQAVVKPMADFFGRFR